MARKARNAWHNVLEALCDVKNWNKLHEQSQQCIDEWPEDGIGYRYRSIAKNELGQHEEAIKDFDKSIDLDPTNSSAFNNRGNAKHNLGQYDAAIRDFNEAIELAPNDSSAFNNRGAAKIKLGQYEEAIKDFNTAIDFNPSFSSAFNNRGVARSAIGQDDEAIKDYNKAIEIDPEYSNAYGNRATAKSFLGKFEEAIRDYDRAIKLGQSNSSIFQNRGAAYLALSRYQEAISDLDRAIEIDDFNENALDMRGSAKTGLGLYKEAIEDFDKAIKLNPQSANSYSNRAVAYGLQSAQETTEQLDQTRRDELQKITDSDKIIAFYEDEIRRTRFRIYGEAKHSNTEFRDQENISTEVNNNGDKSNQTTDQPTVIKQILSYTTIVPVILFSVLWFVTILVIWLCYKPEECREAGTVYCDLLWFLLPSILLSIPLLLWIFLPTCLKQQSSDKADRASSFYRLATILIWLVVVYLFYFYYFDPTIALSEQAQFDDVLSFAASILFLTTPLFLHVRHITRRTDETIVRLHSLMRERNQILFWQAQPENEKVKLSQTMLKYMSTKSTADMSFWMLRMRGFRRKNSKEEPDLAEALKDIAKAIKDISPLKPD